MKTPAFVLPAVVITGLVTLFVFLPVIGISTIWAWTELKEASLDYLCGISHQARMCQEHVTEESRRNCQTTVRAMEEPDEWYCDWENANEGIPLYYPVRKSPD